MEVMVGCWGGIWGCEVGGVRRGWIGRVVGTFFFESVEKCLPMVFCSLFPCYCFAWALILIHERACGIPSSGQASERRLTAVRSRTREMIFLGICPRKLRG